MKLIIDIDENYYEAIKEIPIEQSTLDMLIIRTGKPLIERYGDVLDVTNEILKPCPFCGKNVHLISTSQTKHFVFSHTGLRNCPLYKFEISWEVAKSLKEAIELWNRRADKAESEE